MTGDGSSDLDAAIDAALEQLGETGGEGPVDPRSLALGLRLGLERPEIARRLVAALPSMSPAPGAVASVPGDAAAGDPSIADDPIPLVSRLLARAATLPAADGDEHPEAQFAWVSHLQPGQVHALGRFVVDQLARGAPADLGRGYGVAWGATRSMPHKRFEGLFRELTDLEVAVCGVLAGRDLRATAQASRPRGIAAWFGGLGRGGSPETREAEAVLEMGGRSAQLGFVATWNAWMAVRNREFLAPDTYELLARAWVGVVGPLPDPG